MVPEKFFFYQWSIKINLLIQEFHFKCQDPKPLLISKLQYGGLQLVLTYGKFYCLFLKKVTATLIRIEKHGTTKSPSLPSLKIYCLLREREQLSLVGICLLVSYSCPENGHPPICIWETLTGLVRLL